MVLLQREIKLERRHSTGIALYSRQFATHTVRLEADEQCAASETSIHQFFQILNIRQHNILILRNAFILQ